MRKALMIFIVAVLVTPLVFSAAYVDVDGKKALIAAGGPTIPVGVDLKTVSVQKIGFSGTAVNDLSTIVPDLTTIKMENKLEDGRFSSNEFYVYWKIVCDTSSRPRINLTIQNPMKSSSGGSVDWKVSWKQANGSYNETDIIYSNAASGESMGLLFPVTTTTAEVNTLEKHVESLTLKAETDEPYWMDPAALYKADLWIIITT